jgi:hypothetical protein
MATSRHNKKMKITCGVGAGLAPAQNLERIPNTAGATARVAPTNRIYRRTGIEALTRLPAVLPRRGGAGWEGLIHVMAESIYIRKERL